MHITATHLNSKHTVYADSLTRLGDLIGIHIPAFKKAGYPPIFGGWDISLSSAFKERLQNLVEHCPKRRGVRYTAIQVKKANTLELLFIAKSVAEVHEKLGLPKNMITAVLNKSRQSYAGYIFQDDTVNDVRSHHVSRPWKYLVELS